jgi:hypothetical protein
MYEKAPYMTRFFATISVYVIWRDMNVIGSF